MMCKSNLNQPSLTLYKLCRSSLSFNRRLLWGGPIAKRIGSANLRRTPSLPSWAGPVCLLLDSSPTFSSRPLMSKLVPSRGNVSCLYRELRWPYSPFWPMIDNISYVISFCRVHLWTLCRQKTIRDWKWTLHWDAIFGAFQESGYVNPIEVE